MLSAATQFASKPYSLVSLDDILAHAAVTKGAMYFHFRSKYALATAIVERWVELSLGSVDRALARQHPGVETMVEITFAIAVDDVAVPIARAGFNLLESIGRSEEIQRRVIDRWTDAFAAIALRAQSDGDIRADADATQIARLLVALYLGVRAATEVDDPARYLTDLERAWTLVLPGLANPERVGYLTTFMRRRAALAIAKATS